MTIKDWFSNSGSFKDGVELYRLIPGANNNLIRTLKIENLSNSILLKYELKNALNKGINVSLGAKEEVVIIEPIAEPIEIPLKFILEEANKQAFAKETMAQYPIELHSVFRERISNFYAACELKFQLNRVPDEDNVKALDIILQLEDLWSKIDKAWMVLGYWNDNNRLMPVAESMDYSKLSSNELFKQKALLESRISKRRKTIAGFQLALTANPNDKNKENLYKKKLEELEQLVVDFENIKKLINE